MRLTRVCAALTAIGTFWIAPVSGHHSFAVAFDVERVVSVEGTVTGVKWENPHAWIYVEVEGEDGELEEWQFETLPPNQLRRKGVTPANLTPGAAVAIRGYGAHDRSRAMGAANMITFADGETFSIAAGRQPPLPEGQ